MAYRLPTLQDLKLARHEHAVAAEVEDVVVDELMQVSRVLSQPARKVNVSPISMSAGIGR